jgi:hypothetical protein
MVTWRSGYSARALVNAAPVPAIKIMASSVRREINGVRSPPDGTLNMGLPPKRVLL